jgi:uncharacterized protein YgbK (DUF1537 family)
VSYTQLRLIADDLTGALDSAAAFVGLFPALHVGFEAAANQSLVLNSATRECTADEASRTVAKLASALAPAKDRLCFFKVDSLLRGHAAVELDALLCEVSFDRVIIAPAVPAQRRVSLHGRQHVWTHDAYHPTGEDLRAELQKLGHRVKTDCHEAHGLIWCDASDDHALDQIVAEVSSLSGSVLWVGAAGLASALARNIGQSKPLAIPLHAPLLGLIGSHHPVMRAQLAHVPDLHLNSNRVSEITERMASKAAVMVSCALPEDSTHEAAKTVIEHTFATLVAQLPVPASLFVSGGETLQGLLAPLQARSLVLLGEFEAGIPISRIEGGVWHGVTVISKSGAFGSQDLLERLVSSLNLPAKAIVA